MGPPLWYSIRHSMFDQFHGHFDIVDNGPTQWKQWKDTERLLNFHADLINPQDHEGDQSDGRDGQPASPTPPKGEW
eukprot:CAMPEP_0119104412 /NCGR_PEP_ID=MMETSP1180-20130426/2629_1 /TAXON_ID=3052 ORGANISM="Chlamydomonas cf sp, Strain CCMP681" /NCGR_SAMPLE_ID=MMETSP1180 /ASSEMBLY_ACC=CAM_ASM_000741 /LENGTH=75 /DNA_ID=CAMNT_0007089165 /DNA_START=828 /DNA_END=1055 /DNA_ORIENTATION=-